MASYIKAGFEHDLAELRADLESVELGLGSLVAKVAKPKLAPLIAEMQKLLPFDPSHRGWRGEHKHPDPGHIRDSLRGGTFTRADSSGLTVYTSHPGGPVHWWGGTISPREAEIQIKARPGAGDQFTAKTAEKVGQDVKEALDRLLAEHGLK